MVKTLGYWIQETNSFVKLFLCGIIFWTQKMQSTMYNNRIKVLGTELFCTAQQVRSQDHKNNNSFASNLDLPFASSAGPWASSPKKPLWGLLETAQGEIPVWFPFINPPTIGLYAIFHFVPTITSILKHIYSGNKIDFCAILFFLAQVPIRDWLQSTTSRLHHQLGQTLNKLPMQYTSHVCRGFAETMSAYMSV